MSTLAGLEYGGFRLEQYEDIEPEENIKIFHMIHGPGLVRSHFLDWTPYEAIGSTDFQFLIWFYTIVGRFPAREDKVGTVGALRHGDMEDLVRAVI